ncbi:MAG: undecaprenyl-diphosphate phosphatase [Planctomycetota bacterium]
MTFWESIILGIIQGLTEFLPVSSSGHLAIGQYFFGLTDPEVNLTYTVFLHFVSALAVIMAFFSELLDLFRKNFNVLLMIIIATIPAAVIGVAFENHIEKLFSNNIDLIALGLLFTGGYLFLGDLSWSRSVDSIENARFESIFWVGLAQAVAIIPGISRSGMTIATGLLTGLEKKSAVKFSFFLSVPIILGASLYKLKDFSKISMGFQPIHILAGGVTCFVVSYIAIKLLIKMVQRGHLYWFGIYCLAAGLIVLILRLFGI